MTQAAGTPSPAEATKAAEAAKAAEVAKAAEAGKAAEVAKAAEAAKAAATAKAAAKKDAPASADEGDGEGEEGPMTFWEHLDELRKRLIWSIVAFFVACIVGWEFHEQILGVLAKPFIDSWATQGIAGTPNLNFASPGAAFTGYLKLSMIGGAALASPVIFYQLWSFVAPGLYAREKRYVIPFVLSSTLLFVGGGYFGWRTAFPITFNYFLGMSGSVGSQNLNLVPTVMLNEYIDFVGQMLLGFGLIFELPLLLLFLSVAGVVNYLQLIRFGRWFVLVAFVVSAIITPPEVTSQLLMAVPMCFLYVFSIGLAYVFGKKPTEEQREAHRNRKNKDKEKKAAA